MSVRLTLICHAATRATRDACFPIDEPLEPKGLALAQALAHRGIKSGWTSPALRAGQTASALGIAAVVDAALSDIDLGVWAGRSLTEVAASDPLGLAAWMSDAAASPHEGESIVALIERVSAWLDKIGRGTGSVVAITHPAVIRAVTVIALSAPPISFWRIDVAPLCFARFQGRDGSWTLRALDRGAPDAAA